MVLLFPFLLLLIFDVGVEAGFCTDLKRGSPNTYPIISSASVSRLLNTSTHGKLYQVTVPNVEDYMSSSFSDPSSTVSTESTFMVLHVYGTAYEMGFAHGMLLRKNVSRFVSDLWKYFEEQVESGLLPDWVPKWLKEMIADVGLAATLDYMETLTRPHTGVWIYDEMRGIADGSGASLQTLIRIHMFATMFSIDCSLIGAWGSATELGKTIMMHAVDLVMDGPFLHYNQITVYHPSSGHTFASVGFTAFVGAATGVSDSKLSLGVIGVSFPDESFGTEDAKSAVPYAFLLHDILLFDDTVDDATNRLIEAKRCRKLILAVGDGKMNEVRGYEYSTDVLKVFDDENMMPKADWHPRIENVVYWGMDWICPAFNQILGEQLLEYHGKITPEIGIRDVTPIERSGDVHITYFDLTKMEMYVAFGAPPGSSAPREGYKGQFVQFDLDSLFGEKL